MLGDIIDRIFNIPPETFMKLCDNPAQFYKEYTTHTENIFSILENGDNSEYPESMKNIEDHIKKGRCKLCPPHTLIDLF